RATVERRRIAREVSQQRGARLATRTSGGGHCCGGGDRAAPRSVRANCGAASALSRMPKVHLLDATYELFRAFFAMPSEQTPAGQEVGAVRGLIGSTLALLRDPAVTHLGA